MGHEIEQVYNQVMDEKDDEIIQSDEIMNIQMDVDNPMPNGMHAYVPSTSTPLPTQLDEENNDDSMDPNDDETIQRAVTFDTAMQPLPSDDEIVETMEDLSSSTRQRSKSGKTVRRSFTNNSDSEIKPRTRSSTTGTKDRDVKKIREERRKKMRKS